jgi:hypothetical protein
MECSPQPGGGIRVLRLRQRAEFHKFNIARKKFVCLCFQSAGVAHMQKEKNSVCRSSKSFAMLLASRLGETFATSTKRETGGGGRRTA